jgi:hypothetical protein
MIQYLPSADISDIHSGIVFVGIVEQIECDYNAGANATAAIHLNSELLYFFKMCVYFNQLAKLLAIKY